MAILANPYFKHELSRVESIDRWSCSGLVHDTAGACSIVHIDGPRHRYKPLLVRAGQNPCMEPSGGAASRARLKAHAIGPVVPRSGGVLRPGLRIKEAADQARAGGLNVAGTLDSSGRVASEILRAANEARSDQIVPGTRGKSAPTRGSPRRHGALRDQAAVPMAGNRGRWVAGGAAWRWPASRSLPLRRVFARPPSCSAKAWNRSSIDSRPHSRSSLLLSSTSDAHRSRASP